MTHYPVRGEKVSRDPQTITWTCNCGHINDSQLPGMLICAKDRRKHRGKPFERVFRNIGS